MTPTDWLAGIAATASAFVIGAAAGWARWRPRQHSSVPAGWRTEPADISVVRCVLVGHDGLSVSWLMSATNAEHLASDLIEAASDATALAGVTLSDVEWQQAIARLLDEEGGGQ